MVRGGNCAKNMFVANNIVNVNTQDERNSLRKAKYIEQVFPIVSPL